MIETLATISDKDLFELEKLSVEKDPLFLVEGGFLTIKTKLGEIHKLKLNKVQSIVLDRIKNCFRHNKPVRLWILKARQTGISTLVEAIVYAFTSQKEATNSLVISKDIDSSNYLFGMQKMFQETLDTHLKPEIKHSNEKKLEFEKIHSQVLIDTHDNLDAGRSYTFRLVHLSECSKYRDLSELLLGINQSVPNLPGTMIIGETTANGMNAFYDEWQKAKDGTSDWETIFIPWFQEDEYKLSLENGLYPIEGIEFSTPTDKEKFLFDEKVLKEKHKLSDEQINWRRWCIVNNCNRSVLQFNQEYPDDDTTAFISTGDLFFDKVALKAQEIQKPIAVGNIVKEEGRFVFRNDQSGLFKIYERPVKEGQYSIGADPAEGLENRDKSSAIVLNKKTNRTCATYNHNVPPDRFAEDLIKLGNYFNEALVACENKGYGYSVNQDLYKKYGRVYRKVKTKKGFNEPTLELGFNTNSVSRPQMLAQLAEEIANGSTDLLDKDLIQECWTFINNVNRGQPEAEKGKNDDLVMARSIAGQIRLEHPFKDTEFKKKKKTHYRGLSGY